MPAMKFIARAFLRLCLLFLLARSLLLFPSGGFAAAPAFDLAPIPVANATNAGSQFSPAAGSRPLTFALVQEAAEHGDPVAQTMLGDARAQARGLSKSYFEAVKWYRLAAGQGFAPAQFKLGLCLLEGDGGKQDPVEAHAWFRKAAAQDEMNSIHMVGRFYEEGWGGVPTNHAEAARSYLTNAASGHLASMVQLGKIYAAGRGVPKDPVEAMKWFYLVDQRRTDAPEPPEAVRDFNEARRAVLDNLKIAQTDEAKRRAAQFVFKPLPAPNYQITYWQTNSPALVPAGTAAPLAANPVRPAPAVPASQATAEMVIEVPLQMENNRPYVSVKINGSRTARLLFDSGASYSMILGKVAAKSKLKPTTKVQLNGQVYDAVQGVSFALGGASFSPPLLAIHSDGPLRALDSVGDGIIGADLLQNFVVEIDYRNSRMRLRDPLRYKYTGAGDYLLMRFDYGRPYLDAKIFDGQGRTTTARFLIDTGATSALSLERDFWQTNRIKESIGRAEIGKFAALEGIKRTSMGELNGLQLGHYYIPRPKAVFEEGADGPKTLAGVIGGDILRRFTIIFHYGRQQIILIPNGTPVQPTTMADSASVLNK